MGDGIGQLDEAPLIEEKHESSMRLPSPPAASSVSQVLLAVGYSAVALRQQKNRHLLAASRVGR